jgi:starch synthase (maltosyl-transferring)
MQNRSVIDNVKPQVNLGRFTIQRVVGESVDVSANIFGDSHDYLRAVLEYKTSKARKWTSVEMLEEGNDLWKASFQVTEQAIYQYRIVSWVDHLLTWYRGFKKKQADGQEMDVLLKIGGNLLNEVAGKLKGAGLKEVNAAIKEFGQKDEAKAVDFVLGPVFG